jgi:diguanylate cyclase (GGDEF)-like protein
MALRRSLPILLLAAVLVTAAAAQGAVPYGSLLAQADAVRSNDHAQFNRLLGELNQRVAEATPLEAQQLRYLKAYGLAFNGRYDLAVKEAQALFADTDDPALKLRAGALIVNAHAATRNLSEGLRYLDLTLELIERVPDPELRSHAWFAASALYTQAGQFELSEHYADQILAASTDARSRCFAGLQQLDSLEQLDKLPADPGAIEAAIERCELENEPVPTGFLRTILARQWAKRGDPSPGIALLKAHVAEAEATRYPRLIGEVQSALGELYIAAGRPAEAARYARLALGKSADMEFSLPLVQAHRTLYLAALARGDTAAALEHHVRYAQADRAYLDRIKTREMAYQAVKQETQQKIQTIELLNNQNRVLQLEQQVSAKTSQANRLLIALLTLLVAALGYWAYRTKQRQLSFRRLAETDALTGISNRHHFTRLAERMLTQCRRNGAHAGLVMLDLDNFKSINDQFGHAAGDWTLKEVAQVCRHVCGPDQLVGRIGGEEFALLLVGGTLDACAATAEQCRERIAAIDAGQSGHRFGISASFGVAGSVACGYRFEALLAKADDALYRSKREGRNRVNVHDPAAVMDALAAASGPT